MTKQYKKGDFARLTNPKRLAVIRNGKETEIWQDMLSNKCWAFVRLPDGQAVPMRLASHKGQSMPCLYYAAGANGFEVPDLPEEGEFSYSLGRQIYDRAKKGGSAKSEKKAKTSAENGKKRQPPLRPAEGMQTSDIVAATGLVASTVVRYAKQLNVKQIIFNGIKQYVWTDENLAALKIVLQERTGGKAGRPPNAITKSKIVTEKRKGGWWLSFTHPDGRHARHFYQCGLNDLRTAKHKFFKAFMEPNPNL
jgi:hypothetical protein